MDPDFDTRSLRVTDADPKNFVTSFELRYVPANRFNLARHINAGPTRPCSFWFAQPEYNAKNVRHTFHLAAVQWIDRSVANLNQDLIALGNRFFDLLTLQDIG